MDAMEPKYLKIDKDNRRIFFRVHIEKRFSYSQNNPDYFDYHVIISDEYEIESGLFLVIDDYHNICIYDSIPKEYVGFEVDELNFIHYFYEKLYFTGITLEYLVKEILYQKFVGCGVYV